MNARGLWFSGSFSCTARGVWEMTWSWTDPDGRATWEWIEVDGKPAVRWRRVGTHAVFGSP